MADRSPTARALLALELIQTTPGITAERLAGALGVSERAARRYVGILREAEIPIESIRGPLGGYRVGRGLRLPPLTFSAAEALGLVMAVLDGHHDAADAADPVGGALRRIVRALPETVAAQAELVRRTTSPAPDRAAARPDAGTTARLVQACSEHRQVRLDYRSEAGTELIVEAEPWAVVVRHGRWYLLCRVPAKDALRAYRIDRVRGLEVLDRTFVPPADLDPVALLEEHLAAGWEYEVEIEIDAPAADVARSVPAALARLSSIDAHRSRLTGTTGNPYWFAEQLALIPAAFRVIGGAELRSVTRRLGERLVAAGAPPEPAGTAAADVPALHPRLRQVVLDAVDIRTSAEFYRRLLGLSYRPGDEQPPPNAPDPRADDWLVLRSPGGVGLAFQKVDDLPAPTWPTGDHPQMLHLDTTVPDTGTLLRHRDRAVELGARVLLDRCDDPEEPLYVLADPAGHPFCIFVVHHGP